MRTSIIIPVCGGEKVTRECLDSIYKNTSDFEIIIVDNGSDPAFKGSEKVVRNEKNLGFPLAINQGVKAATGDVIVLLNNDTLVTPHWLEYLQKHLEFFDIVGPRTNECSGPQKINLYKYFNEAELELAAAKYHSENLLSSSPWHKLVFFCVAIKRSVFDKIGFLDEQFSPGNFEDDDFCLRAIEAGLKVGIANDIFIHHIGSATHKSLNIDQQKLINTNLVKFQAKWPTERYLDVRFKACENRSFGLPPKKHTLALVMVVKNEEKGLERAIRSIRGFVDEVVIAVDKSSTDRTAEIAKMYATTLLFFRWRDDFSAVRNLAHAGVVSEWILFLDGHEFVSGFEGLDDMLDTDVDGLLCTIEMENGTIFRNPRIYRNGVQFVGRVHEKQNCKNVKLFPKFVVRHDRLFSQSLASSKERDEQRREQVPRVMFEEWKKDHRNTRASFHLGLHFQGIQKFKEAVKWYKRYLRYSNNFIERWFVFFNLSQCYFARRQLLRAFLAASFADSEIPNRWEIQKMRGLILYHKGKYQKACEYFVSSFHANTGDVSFKPWPRDDSDTWNFIAECFFFLSQFDLASIAFLRASDICKNEQLKEVIKKRSDLMLEIFKKQK